MKNSKELPQNIETRTNIWTNNSTSGCLSEENENSNLERYVYLHVHCSIIYNSQDT